MAGSNLKDPKNNDLASPFKPYTFGDAADSEAHSDVAGLPGVGGAGDAEQATAEAKRAGYGHQFIKGGQGSPFGGHNMDERNQYTVKMKRGSSL
jgi:hypothetical protein